MAVETEQNLVEITSVEGIRYDRHGIARVKVPVIHVHPQTIDLSELPGAKHAWFANLADWNAIVIISSNDTNLPFQLAGVIEDGKIGPGQILNFDPAEITALKVNFDYPQSTLNARNKQLLHYCPTLTAVDGKK
jgi:hypothetical protein